MTPNARSGPGMLVVAVSTVLLATTTATTAQIFYPPPPRSNTYTLVDLGANQPGWSFAHAINDAGHVVGDMRQWDGSLTAFRTQPNQPVGVSDGLGVLYGHYRSYAYGIDASGVVVGESVRNSPYIQSKAFRWGYTGALMEDLHPAFPADNTTFRGTNDYSWNVGNTRRNNGLLQGFISFGPGYGYSLDSWIGFPTESVAHDVNNLCQLVGWRRAMPSSQPRAFLFDAAAGVWRRIDIPPLAGGIWNKAFAINESNQVVGQSMGPSWVHAFMFRDANNNGVADAGEVVDLDTQNSFSSAATAINNNGTAVGHSGDPDVVYGNSRAMLFANGAMTDLNTRVGNLGGWILRAATGINSSGQIVGWMETNTPDQQSRVRHAFRLDPPPPRIIFNTF